MNIDPTGKFLVSFLIQGALGGGELYSLAALDGAAGSIGILAAEAL